MASIQELKGGKWRAFVYVRGNRASCVFSDRGSAERWAAEAHQLLSQSEPKHSKKPIGDFYLLKEAGGYSQADLIELATKRQHELPPASGVYFLLNQGEPVYIGHSRNMGDRIAEHARDKDFDTVVIMPCRPEFLAVYEQMYINRFRPKLNITMFPMNPSEE